MFSGAYVPVTEDGNIVVDRILASFYASFDHNLAHIVMKPIQWYTGIIEWLFGMYNRYPGYVSIAKEFGKWVMPAKLIFGKNN